MDCESAVVRTTPEAVLRTNIASQNIIPQLLEAKSTFEDLWRMSEMTVDELRAYPLEGRDASGNKLQLLVPQLAMIIALSKGPNMSRIQLNSSNLADIARIQAERKELNTDIKKAKKENDHALERRLEQVRSDTEKAPKQMFYSTIMEPFDGPEAQPSFAWLISSMGTGKTIMSILTGVTVLRNEWDACKQNFSRWKGSLRRVSTMIPMGVNPIESDEESDVTGKLTRTMLVISPDAVFGTMAAVIQANKARLVPLLPKNR